VEGISTFFLFFFVVLGLELRAYTLSHSTALFWMDIRNECWTSSDTFLNPPDKSIWFSSLACLLTDFWMLVESGLHTWNK
jgi:hypothetical protein